MNGLRVSLIILLSLVSVAGKAQFLDGGNGLLEMPTAEMEPSGTFMITNNFLNKHALPEAAWGYHTFGYGFSLTFWSRLEFRYNCTIFDGKRKPNPTERDLLMVNQDRHFCAKLLLFKEGDFGLSWAPSVAIGADDIDAGMFKPRQINGFFTRVYVVSSKHFQTSAGTIGAHLGYQLDKFSYYQPTGINVGVDWTPIWINSPDLSVKAIAEYNARTFNVGVISAFWEDRFEAMFELMNFKWVNFGIRYKLHIK